MKLLSCLPRRPAGVYHAALAAVLLAGCGSAGAVPPQTAGVPLDTQAVAAAVERTRPAQPTHVVFSWTLQEGENRFSGKGVARVEPPYRARLDLFGPRDEAYLSAILEERSLRLPAGVQDAPLPPAAMLWSALGVFLEPENAQLVRTAADGNALDLGYRSSDGQWRFRFENGRLERVEHAREGAGRQTVELEPGTAPAEEAAQLPKRSTYRDWAAFRELVLTIDEVRHVASFPASIWSLGGS